MRMTSYLFPNQKQITVPVVWTPWPRPRIKSHGLVWNKSILSWILTCIRSDGRKTGSLAHKAPITAVLEQTKYSGEMWWSLTTRHVFTLTSKFVERTQKWCRPNGSIKSGPLKEFQWGMNSGCLASFSIVLQRTLESASHWTRSRFLVTGTELDVTRTSPPRYSYKFKFRVKSTR